VVGCDLCVRSFKLVVLKFPPLIESFVLYLSKVIIWQHRKLEGFMMRGFYLKGIVQVIIYATVLFLGSGEGYAASADQFFWTEWGANAQNRICRSNSDGSNLTVIAQGSGGNVGQQPYYFGPEGIAVDLAAGYVYWANVNGNKITRATLTGGNQTDLCTSTDPTALALDLNHQKMYWSDTADKVIRRANLDGSHIETVVSTDLLYVEGITIDSTAGKIYWTDIHTDKIKRANLDGTSIETLVSGYNMQAPSGIALDTIHGKMYWTDWATYKIQRSNLNGTQVEDFLTGLSHPGGLAIDPLYNTLYYLDWGTNTMYGVNLLNKSSTPIVTSSGISSLSYLAFVPVPEPSTIAMLLSVALGGLLWWRRRA
jgi:sugar lactone lactonase YvrE